MNFDPLIKAIKPHIMVIPLILEVYFCPQFFNSHYFWYL